MDTHIDTEPSSSKGRMNLGHREQMLSVAGGTALVIAALRRRNLAGLLWGALGVALLRRGMSGHCAIYENLGISSAESDEPGVPDNVGVNVEEKITINRRPEEIFAFWRELSNLPQVMSHLERVEMIDEKHSHWVARTSGGQKVEWDARVINEHPDRLLAWESLPGAQVQNAGSVRFEPVSGDRGTEVTVSLQYHLPGGALTAFGLKLLGQAPEQQIKEDLRRLKQILESGELATSGNS